MSDKLSYEQLYNLATEAGFSGGSALTIAAIADAESGGDPNAVHKNSDGSTDYGVLQINSVHFGHGINEEQTKDPLTSFRYAYSLSKGGTNFKPWSTYNDDSYVAFMPDKHEWSPYSAQKAYKQGVNFGSDPQTGQPFKVSNKIGKPISNNGPTSSKNKNTDNGYNFWDDLQKAAKEYVASYGDTEKGVQTGWGSFKDLSNLPIRVLKVLIGLVLLIGSLVALIAPQIKDELVGTSKPLVKQAIRKAVIAG